MSKKKNKQKKSKEINIEKEELVNSLSSEPSVNDSNNQNVVDVTKEENKKVKSSTKKTTKNSETENKEEKDVALVLEENTISEDNNDKSSEISNNTNSNIEKNKEKEKNKDKKNSKKSNDINDISKETNNNINEDSNSTDDIKDIQESNIKKIPLKTVVIITSIISIVLVLFLLFSTIFAILNANKNTIINGVSVKGIDVSNMTKEDAIKKISNILDKKLSTELVFEHNGSKVSLFPEQFQVCFDVEDAVDTAYLKGRDGNIFENNYQILYSLFLKTNVGPSFSFSEDSLDSLILEMESNFPDRLIEPSYYIEGNNLIITKGKDGILINKDKLKSEISYILNNLECDLNTIDIPTQYKIADKINLEKIHSEIYKAPKDAYYTTNPYVVYPHADGIDFAISIEEATNLLNTSESSFTIPLKVLSPSVTTNQIGAEAFPDLLGSYSTTFSTRNTNRSTNIRLASNKINGIVVMPGETFSYNKTVGKRTAAAGFKSAAVYSGGKVTTGIGGGICQVSSTLYNAVLLANLEIVERYNHGFNTGYVPAGRDATVSWGGPDFVFKNTRTYPVRVVCSSDKGTITCKIFGLKSDNEYEVEIQSYITQYIGYKTINQEDPTLPKGTTKVLESGSNGCRSVAYRILKQNGNVVSKTLLSRDTYNPHNKIVAVGTKEI